MTTGVDIPDLEFIVFLRPCKSRILFEQMLGRGTRLRGQASRTSRTSWSSTASTAALLQVLPERTGMTDEPPEKPTRTIERDHRGIWQQPGPRLQRPAVWSSRCSGSTRRCRRSARELFAAYVPGRRHGRLCQPLCRAVAWQDFTPTMRLLRDPDFQRLAGQLPAAASGISSSRTENVRHVSSGQWLDPRAPAAKYKPEDYLAAFSRFVRDNPERIEAIRILLDRPQDWSTDRADRVADQASDHSANTSRPTICQKRAMHRTTTRRSVDIISMVKQRPARTRRC